MGLLGPHTKQLLLSVTSISVVDGGSGYNRHVPPPIYINRITGDPGLATASITTVDSTMGTIQVITVTNSSSNIG